MLLIQTGSILGSQSVLHTTVRLIIEQTKSVLSFNSNVWYLSVCLFGVCLTLTFEPILEKRSRCVLIFIPQIPVGFKIVSPKTKGIGENESKGPKPL